MTTKQNNVTQLPVKEITLTVYTGDDDKLVVRVFPKEMLERIISGELDIESIDDWKPLVSRIIEEWMHKTLGLSFTDDMGWQCSCGHQLFTILTEGFCCAECGTVQSFGAMP